MPSSPTPPTAPEPAAEPDLVPGAEQPARTGGGPNGAVTALAILAAVLGMALVMMTLKAVHGDASAKETVTVTVTASGAAAQGQQQPAQQQQAQPTPVASQPAEKEKLILGVARHRAGDPMAYGRDDAPVTMVEFADLRCPFCAVFSNKIRPELEQYVKDGTLRYEYRDLPLFGDDSVSAAIAARAAGNQGKYHDYLVALYKAAPPEGGHPAMPKETLLGFAKEAGVADMARFEKDMADPALKQAVLADQAYGTKLGISGTPFFIINTQVLSGAQPVEVFKTFVEYEKQHHPTKR